MSDLTIFGGNIGMRVGSQQFTARDITFTNNAIAVSMIWLVRSLSGVDEEGGAVLTFFILLTGTGDGPGRTFLSRRAISPFS